MMIKLPNGSIFFLCIDIVTSLSQPKRNNKKLKIQHVISLKKLGSGLELLSLIIYFIKQIYGH